MMERLTGWIETVQASPDAYGIRVPGDHLSGIVVADVSWPPLPEGPLSVFSLKYPLWLTADFGANGAHWLIGPDGTASTVGIALQRNVPVVVSFHDGGPKAIKTAQLRPPVIEGTDRPGYLLRSDIGSGREYLIFDIGDRPVWPDDFARFIRGNSLVSGANVRSGFIRDLRTLGHKGHMPFTDTRISSLPVWRFPEE